MQVDEVLEAAAGVIAERGHVKRTMIAEDGRVCALGAISLASGLPEIRNGMWTEYWAHETSPVGMALRDCLGARLGARLGATSISHWNDHPDRTKEEVIETMREAAQQWRKENGDSARSTAGAEGLV